MKATAKTTTKQQAKKCAHILLGAVVLSVVLGAAAYAKIVERVEAVFNSQAITKTYVDSYRARLGSGLMLDDNLLQLTTAQSLKKSRKNLLEFIINEHVLDAAAVAGGAHVSRTQAEQEMQRLLSQNNSSQQELKRELRPFGLSVEDYVGFLQKSLSRKQFIQRHVVPRVRVSSGEVLAAYKTKHKSDPLVLYYKLWHVWADKSAATLKELEQAKELLKADRRSFKELAESYAKKPGFAASGLLGEFRLDQLSGPLRKLVLKLKPGGWQELELPKAHQLVWLELKLLKPSEKFQKAQASLQAALWQKAFVGALNTWLNQERAKHHIRVL